MSTKMTPYEVNWKAAAQALAEENRRLTAVVEAARRFDRAATVTPDMCWAPVNEISDEAGHVAEMPCGKCEPCTLADLRDTLADFDEGKA